MKKYAKGLFDRYEFEIIIIVLAIAAWKLRSWFGLLGAASDGLGNVVAGATASIADASEKAQVRAKLKTVAPHASDQQLDVYSADAHALAGYMGNIPGTFSRTWLFPDSEAVLAIAKKYSRVMFNGGKRVVDAKGNDMLRKPEYRLAVLAPFYSIQTGGRDMYADMQLAINRLSSDKQTLYTKYLK